MTAPGGPITRGGNDAGSSGEGVTGVVTAVRDAHRFDEAALGRWLAGRLPGAEHGVRVSQFEGGQSNPTYLLETGREGETRRWVLRKKPAGPLLASAHMIEREQRVMSALAGSGVPVPEIPLLCEDTSVIGTSFFVMAYVHGRIIRDPALPGMTRSERTAVVRDVVSTLAKLHAVDWKARGLGDFGKPTGYVPRQIARWSRQYRESQPRPLPAMEWLMTWLPAHAPTEAPVAIAHGDFRLDNMVIHPTEPRVLAVLDWELSTLGDPLTDLAYFCTPYHLDRSEKGLRGLGGHDLEALGIPSQDELIDAYCTERGVARPSDETFAFYLAFAFFRLAAIVAGIEARLRQGNASGSNAHDVAAQTETFALAAKRLAEGAPPGESSPP